ncbi:MAG TPA: kelch repeat-containing protein, partial [Pyrinomonadaceae bacterium]|nr:kelch repeat-containing protein [Pyrinomonadaceae bacterium]
MRTKPPITRRTSIHSFITATIRLRTGRAASLTLITALAITSTVLTSASSASSLSPISQLNALLFSKSRVMSESIQPNPPSAKKVAAANVALNAAAPSSTNLNTARRGHTSTRLNDGRVLVAGGENSGGVLNVAEIFDPATGLFTVGGNMTGARVDHAAVKLADGRVFLIGGRDGVGTTGTTEIFDPTAGTFTSGPAMSVARAGHSATLFADGRVFVVGGDGGGTAEIYDPAANSFSGAGGSLDTARSMHSAALMLDGRILIAGGRADAGGALDTVEIFDPPAGSFSTVDGVLTLPRVQPHLRVLFDGKVQIIGGNNDGSMEIYDPLFAGIGAYAHVLPETDPCPGLINQILASQTRAALFYLGSSDASRDRIGHTITELAGNQALVLGGA